MDRLTQPAPGGGYTAGEHSPEELLAALGKYEDLYESVGAELELVRLNLQELSKAGKARSATYTMLSGSRFLLEEMQKRLMSPVTTSQAGCAPSSASSNPRTTASETLNERKAPPLVSGGAFLYAKIMNNL